MNATKHEFGSLSQRRADEWTLSVTVQELVNNLAQRLGTNPGIIREQIAQIYREGFEAGQGAGR